ncbi:kinase-like protein [Leucogyrophana mollusca]|uniref:Kinase-like protein n=1 Tax=Leucogyrophana mollusca TaxID=85980 RepID=A0ACB8B9S7_9AGAM|nr:kinase-like protein [Leucogyrophana mollusca]
MIAHNTLQVQHGWVLDHDEGDVLRRACQRLERRACKAYDQLPSVLRISDIALLSNEPAGIGGFSDIFRASNNGQLVALKRIRISSEETDQRELRRIFRHEALVWKNLAHKYVLPFLGITNDVFKPHWCMVLPWMERGNINSVLDQGGHRHIHVRRFLYEVAQGLAYIHLRGIVHGDLRGANILVDDNWHPQLADFGLASFADPLTSRTSTGRGSPRWMAPELQNPDAFRLRFHRTRATDIYAFGCTCLELYTRKIPFHDVRSNIAVTLKIINGERPPRPSSGLVAKLSDDMWTLIEACWHQSHQERPSADEVVKLMTRNRRSKLQHGPRQH